ncbi:MAG: serine protease [Flavobacteriales bacterium]|nr:serine protease [Flavobacteriales bacterium]
MALLHPSALDTVVAIGVLDEHKRKKWIGTGFLFGMYTGVTEGEIEYHKICLVTNKHVALNHHQFCIKFNPTTDQSSKDFIIDKGSAGKTNYHGHNDPNVDVGVFYINIELVRKQGMKLDYIKENHTAFRLEQMRQMEISEGHGVYVLGFPMALLDTDRQYVIVREGCIARIRDLYEGRKKDFLCDALVFPGNSGGPLFIKPEVTAVAGTKSNYKSGLIGIVKSYIPYQDVAISVQTKRPRITFEENSGLSSVEPVDHIIETIQQLIEIGKAEKK